MQTQEVILNLFPIEEIKVKDILEYKIIEIDPQTVNKEIRYKIAANLVKKLSQQSFTVFSIGDRIYSTVEIPIENDVKIEISGTKIEFKVKLSMVEKRNLEELPPNAITKLVNKLVDWFCQENFPKSFRIKDTNYVGKNLFAEFQVLCCVIK